jgi:thymidylate synthase (FAD)
MQKKFNTKRTTIPDAEDILGEAFPVLDHGFIRLVDYMGGDDSIVQAARVSYGAGTKKIQQDRGLIRYLMRHRHTTPFEMVELKFHAKMPIFVARQWVRHRTANINEYSARYSILDKEFYIPEPSALSVQSKTNKQGRAESIPDKEANAIIELLKLDANTAYDHYEHLLNEDLDNPGQPKDPDRSMLTRELARMDLPINFYTQWYWKIDLHNLFHFLGLRMDPHAQHEIREYADKMADITQKVAPIAYGAFADYVLDSQRLSGLDVRAIRKITRENQDPENVADEIFFNKRERAEFLAKHKRIFEDD